MSINWDDERNVATLRRLWDEGRSTIDIGIAMGIGKNSVVGKAHRLGLQPRASPIKRNGNAPVETKKAQRLPGVIIGRNKAATPIEVVRAIVPDAPVTCAVRPAQCCWPVGDPRKPDFRFCEALGLPGKPYCPEHQARSVERIAA